MQVSIPSASTSILRIPSSSMSSLSHSMKVRSSIAPLPIGTVSVSGRSVRMKPPTCCDRWRGIPTSCSASLTVRLRCGSERSSPASLARASSSSASIWPQMVEASAAVTSSRKPHHLADFADRRARAVVDHGRGDPGAVAAVFLDRCAGSPPRAAHARNRRRCRAARARSSEMKRSNNRSLVAGSTAVIPRQ